MASTSPLPQTFPNLPELSNSIRSDTSSITQTPTSSCYVSALEPPQTSCEAVTLLIKKVVRFVSEGHPLVVYPISFIFGVGCGEIIYFFLKSPGASPSRIEEYSKDLIICVICMTTCYLFRLEKCQKITVFFWNKYIESRDIEESRDDTMYSSITNA